MRLWRVRARGGVLYAAAYPLAWAPGRLDAPWGYLVVKNGHRCRVTNFTDKQKTSAVSFDRPRACGRPWGESRPRANPVWGVWGGVGTTGFANPIRRNPPGSLLASRPFNSRKRQGVIRKNPISDRGKLPSPRLGVVRDVVAGGKVAARERCVAANGVIGTIGGVSTGGGAMAGTRQTRESITTRIDAQARQAIERVAAERRTTPAQVARVLLEDAAKELARDVRAA